MEIPACWFFSFWALISITFLHLGFNALDKTGLSTSVSPAVMSFFKHSLAVSTCSSSSYVLIFRPRFKLAVERRYFWIAFGIIHFLLNNADETILWGLLMYALLNFSARLLHFFPVLKMIADRYSLILNFTFFSGALFPWYIHFYTLINFMLIAVGEYYMSIERKTCIGIHMAIESSLFFIRGDENTNFFPILVILISFFVSAFRAAFSGFEPYTSVSWDPLSGDECFREMVPVSENRSTGRRMLDERRKWIEFAVGMVGTILFQNFFRLTSFDHVLAFLYLAVSWLGNLALFRASSDLGVFNFLLGNVIVGCTVSQFGLRGTTWIAYGASILLYGLRLKLESLSLVDRGERAVIILW
ncbi:hypothetical protein DH2020_028813 [Rehmannia glutinosa]|uniref:Uncharacterized protein n=1 Tax=Rehmannia glutinosa TaxID=99300 RepID=A0ABR0VTD1_REHGL